MNNARAIVRTQPTQKLPSQLARIAGKDVAGQFDGCFQPPRLGIFLESLEVRHYVCDTCHLDLGPQPAVVEQQGTVVLGQPRPKQMARQVLKEIVVIRSLVPFPAAQGAISLHHAGVAGGQVGVRLRADEIALQVVEQKISILVTDSEATCDKTVDDALDAEFRQPIPAPQRPQGRVGNWQILGEYRQVEVTVAILFQSRDAGLDGGEDMTMLQIVG